jgi:Spy/CpxP family protein refolding chaperone
MNKKNFLLISTWALIMIFAGVRAYSQNPASQAASQAGSAASQAGNAAGNAASQAGDATSHAAAQAKDDVTQTLDPEVKAKVAAKLQKLSDELNLTDDQKTQLKPVLQGEVKDLKGVHDDSSLSADQKQQKMTEIHDSAKSQIGSILTPDQQKKLAELKESDDN